MADGATGARDGLSSVTRGTLLMLLGTLGWVAENFIARVLLVRALPAEQWGEFSLGLALAGLLSAFGALGLPQAVARNLPFASGDDERRSILRAAFSVVVPAAVVLAGALFSYGAYLMSTGSHLGLTLELFALSIGFTVVSGLIASVFQGYEDVLPNALFAQIINPSLFIVFLILAAGTVPFHLPSISQLSNPADYVGFLAGSRSETPLQLTYPEALYSYLAAAALTLLALVLYARRRLPRLLPRGPRAPGVSRRLLYFAAPLFVVGVLGLITQSGDTLLLGAFKNGTASGLSQVGFYTAPLSLGRLLLVGLGSLGYIFLPVASRFVREDDREAMQVTYATATKWMVLTSLPLFLLFFFLPDASLRFVYGALYTSGDRALQILVLGAFLSSIFGPSTATQVAYGQTRLLMYNTMVTAIVDVVLSVLLIPPFGIAGAAVAWAVANTLYPALSAVELAFLEDVHPFRTHFLLPLALTGIPLSLLLAVFPPAFPFWSLPLLVVGFAALYVLAVVATGSIDRGDRMLLEVVEGFLGRPVPFVRWLNRLRYRLVPPRPGAP